MKSSEQIIEIDDSERYDDDPEDGEQNLEDEAEEMLKLWDRDQLMKEVHEGVEQSRLDKKNKNIEYYDGQTPFSEIINTMDTLDGDNVYIKIIESNPDGKEIKATHTILFDQIGYLEYNEIPFESSIYNGRPNKINLFEGPIIPGLLKGLLSMRQGESANIMISPALAYGPLGCMPLIPGDAFLYYNVKVHNVWEESLLNNVLEYERSSMVQFRLEDKLKLVEEHKNIANTYLKDGQIRDAVIRYKAAIKCLDEVSEDDLLSNKEIFQSMITLLQNLTIAFNKLKMHKAATRSAKRALSMDPTSIKAYYQLAKARLGLNDYSGTLKWIEKACKISPHDEPLFNHLRLELDFQSRDEKLKRDEIMKKMAKAFI